MEKEFFFSGYCRVADSSRTVCLVTEEDRLTEVDCGYERCPYALDCPVGKEIAAACRPPKTRLQNRKREDSDN